jgi:hypothetical protein
MRHGSDRRCCCHDRQLTVYLISLLRSTKKARLTQEKAIEANRTTTIMPPIVPPNDISLAFAHDGDDDDNDDAAVQNDVLELVDPPPYNTVTTVVNPYAKKPPPAASHEDPKPSADRLVVDARSGNSFVVPGVVDGSSSVNDIALFLRQTPTIFNEMSFVNRVRSLNFANTSHLDTTQRHIHRIFECLKCHPQLQFLADSIPDPEAIDKIIPRLYLLVRGVPTEARMEVLNSVMCFFGESLFLKSYDGMDISILPPDERAKVSKGNESDRYCLQGTTN